MNWNTALNEQLRAVGLERASQVEKWGKQPKEHYWLPILLEEVGEVAAELPNEADSFKHMAILLGGTAKRELELGVARNTSAPYRPEHLIKELRQVAAVALAWAQALENGEA